MPMFNLLEYSENYSVTSGSMWNFYRDEVNHDVTESDNTNTRIKSDKTITSKSFEYKAKIIGRTPDYNDTLHTKVVFSLRSLSNFWRFLHLPLINCETKFDLSRSKESIISEISITPAVAGNPNVNPPVLIGEAIQTTEATFQIFRKYKSRV